jgi:putative SOS response-associated peptidase YedK
MCSGYVKPHRYLSYDLNGGEVWRGQPGALLRWENDEIILRTAVFGLIPPWVETPKITFGTHNARSETVASKPSFRNAWRKSQFCVVPMQAFYEPYYANAGAKAAWWQVGRHDGQAFSAAAIWDQWLDRLTGELIESFSLLTVNADHHPVMSQLHQPSDEKRSIVVMDHVQALQWMKSSNASAAALLQLPGELYRAGPKGTFKQANLE